MNIAYQLCIQVCFLLDEQRCNLCCGNDPLMSREVLKEEVKATQSIDGVSFSILPTEEVTKH